jgi:hypothetical protein
VLKYIFIKENKKSRFAEQMSFWKDSCVKNKHIVELKDYYFHDDSNACF